MDHYGAKRWLHSESYHISLGMTKDYKLQGLRDKLPAVPPDIEVHEEQEVPHLYSADNESNTSSESEEELLVKRRPIIRS